MTACERVNLERVSVRCGHRERQTRSAPSPALATELGFTRVRSLNDWPKSDISDFGWRGGEGRTCTSLRVCPHPNPPPQAGEGTHRVCRAVCASISPKHALAPGAVTTA